MNPTKDLYSILGVPPNALSDDIRTAYRQAARRLHPDVNANPGAATQFWREDDVTSTVNQGSAPYCVTWLTRFDTWNAGDCIS